MTEDGAESIGILLTVSDEDLEPIIDEIENGLIDMGF